MILVIGDKHYPGVAVSELSIRHSLALQPEALFLTAVTIWAARVTAGEEMGLLDAVDIPAASVRWIAEPSDKKAAAAGKAQPRSGAPKRKK